MVTSGLRLGMAAATTRGMGPDEIGKIADVILGLIRGDDPANHRRTIQALCEAFPLP